MAGIKYILQKEVFDSADERILSVCNVTKLMKKKKSTSYLCIISQSKPRTTVTVVQVKQQDKGVYKRKRQWQLDEVKLVDGKSDAPDTHEFDIHLEKQYKWFMANLHERQNFINVLYKQIQKHVQGEIKAKFVNIPRAWLTDGGGSPEKNTKTSGGKGKIKRKAILGDDDDEDNGIGDGATGRNGGDDDDDDDDGYEDFHALTEKEEIDLTKLISECNYAISNAELFMEQLTLNLQDLDGANVQSVLASEKQVDVLMEQIELAINEAEKVEKRLDEYDEILCHTRDSMEKMGEKNSMIDIANKNNIKLLQELEHVVTQLDLPYAHQIALTETDLTGPVGLTAAIAAGRALQNAMNSDIDQSLLQLTAVQDQRKRFEKWKAKFSQTINRHLNNLFIHFRNDLSEAQLHMGNIGSGIGGGVGVGAGIGGDLALLLPKHNQVHKELAVYGELMHWTKAMDRRAYDALSKVYTDSMGKVYEREIRHFFDQARQLIGISGITGGLGGGGGGVSGMGMSGGAGNTGTLGGGGGGGRGEDLMNTSMTNKLKGTPGKQTSQPTYGILGINKDLWSHGGVDAGERQKFDSILERVLAELEPVALSEQIFCIQFFQLDVLSPTTKNTQTTLDGSLNADGGSGGGGGSNNNTGSGSGRDERDSSISAIVLPQKRIDRQINEDVRRMMIALFGILEPELNNFILSFEKLDSFYSMYVLVRLTQHVMSAQDAQSFLSMTFASALVQVKRSFDKFMQTQLQSIKDSKLPKRSKCGLLPYVDNFEEFAKTAESIFRKAERRNDLDKWYIQLVSVIFEQIPIHAQEHAKTPHQVVKMENFHRMHSILAQLKVIVLDGLKKDAKYKYNEALRAYVTKYFGRPLEKLNLFFEGVQQKVSQGVKETEISYQMAYSKQELRKVISQYPAREVKKGLESLYKKVEKHLCEEENLLQVVWRAMQEEFIVQYNFLEERIQRCYAGSMITLDFTINDILAFFSEIARSH